MNLDKSWEEKLKNEEYYDINEESYLLGASDFQEQAIEKLEDFIEQQVEYNKSSEVYENLKMTIAIIKNLKAE